MVRNHASDVRSGCSPGKDRVEKTYNNEKAEAHINQIKRNIDIMNELKIKTLDTYENEKIISKYVENGKSYDKILLEYLEQENNEKFFSEIKTYQNRITKILKNVDYVQIKENNVFTKYNVECEEELLEKLHFVKHGLWDLIFQNAFYLFRRALSVISTLAAKCFAVSCTSKFADCKRKTINNAIRTDRNRKNREHLLS